MNINMILGIILLVGGAVLLYLGYTGLQDVAGPVNETFMGQFTNSTIWHLVLGIGMSIPGAVLLTFRKSSGSKKIEYLDWRS